MRKVLALLAALVFVLYSSVLAAAPARACCMDADCPVTQCVAAACTPCALPAAVGPIAGIALLPLRMPPPAHQPALLPRPLKQIWRPPD